MKYCTACNEKFDDSLSFCPKDGEVLEEDPSSLIGTALDGQYQIEALLGKGGMGAVYRANHILLGDRVAIKVLPPEMRSNTEWLRRFQREGQAARRFRHPNAVTVYDLRTSADGTIYLVMEYVEGVTLDAELRKHGRFSPAEALAVLDPIMSVLNAAHAMGVVHRDLKPENIMIGKANTGSQPVVKLLDLGIAKLREVAGAEKTGNTALTIAGQMLGTPYYMSPEQWGELPRDNNSEIDGRADIYSLGVVFYELIAGARPFKGLTLSELRREHVSTIPPLLHEVVSEVPEGFSRAVARAIAKDRDDRPDTADQFESELRDSLTNAGISTSASFASGSRGTLPADATSRRGITAAERTAATIVGDPAFTGAADSGPAAAIADVPSQAATMPTVVAAEKPGNEPAVAIPSRPTMPHLAEVATPVAPQPRRSPLLLVGAGAIVLLLIVGVGGYALVHFMGNKPSTTNTTQTDPNAGTTGGDVATGGHEVGRYWLELDSGKAPGEVRAGNPVVLESNQSFKFHFSPSENGSLYIIGPGNENAPTTFLTAHPGADSGLKSNEVKSGLNFSFPANTEAKDHWITLDKTPGTDEFTVIFSPNPLTSPAFLNGAVGHELTADEQNQLNAMREQFRANSVGTEVIKAGASPSVSIKVPQTGSEGAPVIFKVRIEHK